MRVVSVRIAVTAVLSVILVLALGAAVLAGPPWTDASNVWWQASYGVSDTQVATVADGFPDGTFKPANAVTRGQFAKMAMSGLDLPTADPGIPTFMDVAKGTTFYTYIEGAHDQGLIGGYPSGGGLVFKPNNNITRQQTNSILGRYLSDAELEATNVIHGPGGLTYASLALWYAAQGGFYLDGYIDANQVAPEHRATTAYLVYHGVVQGSGAKLNPTATLNRAQAAVMVLRVAAEAAEITTPPPAPTDLAVTPPSPGNDATPLITGHAIPNSAIAVYDTFNGVITKLTETSTNAAGNFYADLLTPLADGTHSFTAKVQNSAGIVSAASLPVIYVLDSIAPTGTITDPVVPEGEPDKATNDNTPAFTVTPADDRSGVRDVTFQYAVKQATPAWLTIGSPDTTAPYAADWGTASGLADGQYLFRAVVTDLAGNFSILAQVQVTVDTGLPTVNVSSMTPQDGTGGIYYTENHRPTFTADADDPLAAAALAGSLSSGVAKMDFFRTAWTPTVITQWTQLTLISTDLSPAFGAAYPVDVLDGDYLFAARATDRASNENVLASGSPATYSGPATRHVIIDSAAPLVTITAPVVGALLPDATNYTITWTLSDVSAPTSVKIEFSPSGAEGSWTTIADAAPFTPGSTGSYLWTAGGPTGVPDISGADVTTNRIRITAVDRAGVPVGNVAGHTTVVTSGAFTIYDAPAAATNVVGSDPDASVPGIDWHDFHATWTPSISGHIASQRVYLLRSGLTPVLGGASPDTPVATIPDNTTAVWGSTSGLAADSRGMALAATAYKIWVVSTDPAGRTVNASSADFTPVSE